MHSLSCLDTSAAHSLQLIEPLRCYSVAVFDCYWKTSNINMLQTLLGRTGDSGPFRQHSYVGKDDREHSNYHHLNALLGMCDIWH